MKNSFEQLKMIRMTHAEKQALKERLFSSIKVVPIESPYLVISKFSMRARSTVASGFALMLLAIFIQNADASLPGQLLYGMKRDVNEKVLAAFAFSPTTKAKVETTLATRRLEEIEHVMLSVGDDGISQELKNEVVTELATAATEHSLQATVYIENMHQNGDTGEAVILASKLETTLSIHEGILEEIDNATSDENYISPVANALAIIKTSGDMVDNFGGTIKDDITLDPTLIDEMTAKEHFEEAKNEIDNFENEFGVESLQTDTVVADILTLETQKAIGEDAASNYETENIADALFDNVNDGTGALSPENVFIITETAILRENNVDESTMSLLKSGEDALVTPVVLVREAFEGCRSLLVQGEFAASFLKCTDVIEGISVLRIRMNLTEKTQTEVSLKDKTEGVLPEIDIETQNTSEIKQTESTANLPIIESLKENKGFRTQVPPSH